MKNFFIRQFNKYEELLRFSIVGMMGAIIDIGVLTFCVEILKFNIISANCLSVGLAIINNFFLNKYWTFKNKNRELKKQFTKYAIVSIIGWLLNFVLMKLFLWVDVWYLAAKIIIILIVSIWNYALNKLWTFKKNNEINQLNELTS